MDIKSLHSGTLVESVFEQFQREVTVNYTEKNPSIVLWFEEVIAHFVETMHGAWDSDFHAAAYTLIETIKVLDEMGALYVVDREGYFLFQSRFFANNRPAPKNCEDLRDRYPSLERPIDYFGIVLVGTVGRQEVRDYLCGALDKLLQIAGPKEEGN